MSPCPCQVTSRREPWLPNPPKPSPFTPQAHGAARSGQRKETKERKLLLKRKKEVKK
jgi:hypothetical protein